ncbi:MFS transporter [Draconibacterium sp. IB214405]|uniref:MFS transporter n=1 Tax=Draconibacterium sp. IB214405 TaxID=3097352 RepID=UPI002A104C66|nr:MFS transporter [Draconibacterium sp. IB214405]MDX8338061.1 MFS transporter [Draconibacterium sp. IB214405]
MAVLSVLKGYNKSFWTSNVIELFERWAWYGFYLAFPLFLVGSTDTGALGFSNAEKGAIMGTGSALLYFLPVITGAIADKIGYKKVLLMAFAIYASGFYMINIFEGYALVYFAFIWTCVGGAFFKPIISAMIAKTTTDETASIGFGIFYMMVNIGGFIGPFIAGALLKLSWEYVFYMAIAAIGVNVLLTLFMFKEPGRDDDGTSLGQNILKAFVDIYTTLKNWKYVMFLVIMILFWSAFNQLYYSFGIFVDQWIDTTVVYNGLHAVWPWLAETIGDKGTISAVTMTSMDSFFIIVFQIMVSAFVMRFRPLAAMMGGILVLAGGLCLMFSMQSGWLILLGILIFALGEMGSSPKFTEYVGKIAPASQKALYMGTSFLPVAAGHKVAGWLSGDFYERISDKFFLLQKEVAQRGFDFPAEYSDTFTKNDFFAQAAEKMNMTQVELTNYLWQNYHPSNIWMAFSGIAVSAVVFLWLYDRFVMGGK